MIQNVCVLGAQNVDELVNCVMTLRGLGLMCKPTGEFAPQTFTEFIQTGPKLDAVIVLPNGINDPKAQKDIALAYELGLLVFNYSGFVDVMKES